VKPAPVTLTSGADKSALALLVSVTVWGLLFAPAGHLPKLIFFVDSPTTVLFLVDEGPDWPIASPPTAHETAIIAVTILTARRITRRRIQKRHL
jgi:hypothetical protein